MTQRPFRADRFFAFRTPLLPHWELQAWGRDLQSAGVWEDPEALQTAFGADVSHLRERLRILVSRPEVLEAIYLASPDLVDSLPRWMNEPDSEKGKRTELSLIRYLHRMCHRPTPFGLFAGHSLGRIGERTRLVVTGRERYRRTSRLDMDYLSALVAELQKDRGLRDTLTYRPNTSLYHSAGRLRYIEIRLKDGQRNLQLVALREDDHLLRVMERAKEGATIEDLKSCLVNEEISGEEANEFVHELIDNQVVVPDLEPATTGNQPLKALVERLRLSESTWAVADRLAMVGNTLAGLDEAGIGNGVRPYLNLATDLEELPGKVDRTKLWQVDLFKPAPEATLSGALMMDMEEAVSLLRRLTPVWETETFKAFKEAFQKRYEGRFVPLMEALDPECGVGINGTNGLVVQAAPLLEGLALDKVPRPTERPGLTQREVYLLKRIQPLKPGQAMELDEKDLNELDQQNHSPWPTSFFLRVEMAADGPEALEAGEYRAYLHSANGPSAARLLGRFCHGDQELAQEVRRHLAEEEAQKPDAIFAEIAHLPFGRLGNVLARPLLRSHEIPYLGASGAEPDAWITVSDLMVGIRGDRVILWSRRLDKEVLPRLSSAANYNHRVSDVYRFLASLQDQAVQGFIGWTWGGLDNEPWLPRVTRGKYILDRARWQITKEELKEVLSAKSPPERFRAFQELRREKCLPRYVLLADGDNELPVDMENPLGLESLWSVTKSKNRFQLSEDYPGGDHLVVAGPEGRFTHELVLTFLARPEATEPALSSTEMLNNRTLHGPGSEWLYSKIYCGQASADELLAGAVTTLSGNLLRDGDVDRWFFIRYSDPEPHLRLRFHGAPERLWGQALSKLNWALEPLLRGGVIWRFQIDTYEPETFRYGGSENLMLSEQIFQADSEAVLEILALYPGDEGTAARWRLAVRTVDGYFEAARLSLNDRYRLAQRSRDILSQEFGLKSSSLKRHICEKFRTERKHLETLLDPDKGLEGPLASGVVVLRALIKRIRPIIEEMRDLEAQGRLIRPVEEVLVSFIHMSLNRLLRSAQQTQELVVYDFLCRIYDSRLARERKTIGDP